MSSTSPRLSRADAREQTRGRVLAAARAVFVRDGFHRASTDAIANEAGFTRGALYANWRTKEDLFFAVFDAEVEARLAVLTPPPSRPFAQAIRELAARSEAMIAEDPGWSLLMIEFTAHAARHPDLARRLHERNAALVERIAAPLGAATGGTALQARRAAHVILVLQSGVAVERTASGQAFPAGLLPALAGRALADVAWLSRLAS